MKTIKNLDRNELSKMILNRFELHKIRNWVRGMNPLYVSICAALFLDLKSNMKWDSASILYFLGLISFIIACIISNDLSNRCNNYGRIYDIRYNKLLDTPQEISFEENLDRKSIYNDGESEFTFKRRFFQYYGVFCFGLLGLFFVMLSYFSLKNQTQRFDYQNKTLQHQVDSLKLLNIGLEGHISQLKQTNDSIKNVRLDEYILNLNTLKRQNYPQSKIDSVHYKNQK